MEHQLKTVNPHFTETFNGNKTFEVRINDRDFEVGDTLRLREYDADTSSHSGRWVRVLVTHILQGYPAVKSDHIVMSTTRINRCDWSNEIDWFTGKSANITHIDTATFT